MGWHKCIACGAETFHYTPNPLCNNCDAILLGRVVYAPQEQYDKTSKIVDALEHHHYTVHPRVKERLLFMKEKLDEQHANANASVTRETQTVDR
jgi:predicted  nucleic acid-binding Zn-ribbon protein